MSKEYNATIRLNRWGAGDTYLTVECQVEESDFKAGDKVKVTIEKVSVE